MEVGNESDRHIYLEEAVAALSTAARSKLSRLLKQRWAQGRMNATAKAMRPVNFTHIGDDNQVRMAIRYLLSGLLCRQFQ
jgi:hypothetical protein